MVYRDVVVPPCVLSYDAVDEGEETAGKSKTTKQLKYEDGSIKAPAFSEVFDDLAPEVISDIRSTVGSELTKSSSDSISIHAHANAIKGIF